jgi:prolyl-tRNA editing enzyme YbaK/EbsC (Cys-tRNA(Pro) deacylase)
VSVISYENLKRSTGTAPVAVCPLLLKIPLFIDKHVFDNQKINFGLGDHKSGLEIKTNDLDKDLSFNVVDVT